MSAEDNLPARRRGGKQTGAKPPWDCGSHVLTVCAAQGLRLSPSEAPWRRGAWQVSSPATLGGGSVLSYHGKQMVKNL